MEEATKTNNTYTLNHIELNQAVFKMQIFSCAIMVFIFASQRNFGVKISISFVYNFFVVVLTVARLAAMTLYVMVIWPQLVNVLRLVWTIGKRNTWKSPDEPYFTNCSTLNMVFAFFNWLGFITAIYVLMFWACFLAVGFIVQLYKGRVREFCSIFGTVLREWGTMLANLLLGTTDTFGFGSVNDPFLNSREKELRKPDSNLKRREDFLNSAMKLYAQVRKSEEEARECPICLVEFCDKNAVV